MFVSEMYAKHIDGNLWRVARCTRCWSFKNTMDRKRIAFRHCHGCTAHKAMYVPAMASNGATN